jgi:DNA-binding CsgD family transcriptional regulator
LCLGEPTELVAQGLARAAAIRRDDAGVDSLELVVSSQVTLRMHGAGPVLHTLAALPAASATPLAATGALAFRGALRTALGLFADADRDLTEVTRRLSDGEAEVGAGSYQAQLGWVRWLTGDWGRSRVSFRQAFDSPSGIAHQFTLALAPLVDIGVGRFDVADAGLARAREVLTDSPWPEACVLALGTTLVRLHAGGSARERATALERWQDGPLRVVDVRRPSPVFLLNYIPALLWAGRLDDAAAAVSFLAHIKPAAPWSSTVAHWYGGLVRAARGDVRAAFDELGSALAGPLGLPLYRAHLLLDHAELARRLDRPGAESSLRQAQEIYDRLGAAPYLERVHRLLATPVERLPGGVALTEREHDVLTLIVAGMSYAQISRELFITQSTVGYHLGNIYRKAGVSTRHQLTEKARRSPRTFGI